MNKDKTIVVIDDHDYVNESIEIAISHLFSIRSFTSVQSAYKYLVNTPSVHGFIVDYHIGPNSGLEFIRDSVRPLYPKIPAILISAFYDRDIPNVDQAEINQQFVANLTKPFDVQKLQQVAENVFSEQPVH
ncbi:MAG: hypothetical protein P8L47_01215 [Candidatus Marinamargulisbacteria bacterium]|jgi:response regulator RpfG family c-di-GMP phosphodiesterase|nr:hypothetical protein [bacterium]MDG2264721.1 hypothetical protein [Candidatus Marinamargulisbacteria bacterium]|tara:strand:+ start:1815 stop:2207 length:393 start_codon:yes stop_codon:yes gene_type:complete